MLFNPHTGPQASQLLSKSLPSFGKQRALAVKAILRRAGLRPTRQRIALGSLLFVETHRHITPGMLNEEALLLGEKLSVATVYNTLNQFADAGLIRKISIHGERTYFDTDTGDHAHFYICDQDQIVDIASGDIGIGPLPVPPAGYKISKVDVLIHLVPETTPS
ncbi:transcriptional repressor [Ochrobactrum sp. Marseille-Q0166]|nr:transcriptional repressor [Ochrobactrum sp. Marseille-Q0166]